VGHKVNSAMEYSRNWRR